AGGDGRASTNQKRQKNRSQRKISHRKAQGAPVFDSLEDCIFGDSKQEKIKPWRSKLRRCCLFATILRGTTRRAIAHSVMFVMALAVIVASRTIIAGHFLDVGFV